MAGADNGGRTSHRDRGEDAVTIDMQPTPESEPVESIGYDEPSEEVWVTFRSGSTYVYSGVPAAVFELFRTSDSKGSFVHHELRGVYPYRRD
jgi:hypothetical protein